MSVTHRPAEPITGVNEPEADSLSLVKFGNHARKGGILSVNIGLPRGKPS